MLSEKDELRVFIKEKLWEIAIILFSANSVDSGKYGKKFFVQLSRKKAGRVWDRVPRF